MEVLLEEGPDGMARTFEILTNEAMKLERSSMRLRMIRRSARSLTSQR